jgi:hypothetical protein
MIPVTRIIRLMKYIPGLLSENATNGFGGTPIFATGTLPVMGLSAEATVIAAKSGLP